MTFSGTAYRGTCTTSDGVMVESVRTTGTGFCSFVFGTESRGDFVGECVSEVGELFSRVSSRCVS